MPAAAKASFKRWGYSWLAFVAAFAIHVVDEALTDFLPLYNSIVTELRESYHFVPFPTFTFDVWLGGLVVAIVTLALMTPLPFAGRRYFRFLAYPLSIIMIFNGLAHIGASLYWGRLAPGAISSPLLIIAAVALLVTTTNALGASKAGNVEQA